jgi:hypothetical protein
MAGDRNSDSLYYGNHPYTKKYQNWLFYFRNFALLSGENSECPGPEMPSYRQPPATAFRRAAIGEAFADLAST